MDHAQSGSSYDRTRVRFDTSQAARKYAARQTNSRRQREQGCIRMALQVLPEGARVLDLPCGAGRLCPMLADIGLQVTGADSSEHMIKHAEEAREAACRERPERRGKVVFVIQDIMHTTFPDRYFDAAVCNRLFHHFCEPAMRCAALAELGRI